LNNDVDVVLLYPMLYEPNIHAHHERYLKEEDWNALLQAIDELQPEYAKLFPKILTQEYMFNYNIVLAKKEESPIKKALKKTKVFGKGPPLMA
jgi:hypothetical protein